MAVVDRFSTALTNRNASPPAQSNPQLASGTVLSARATFALANGDSIGSTYRICQLPSNASIKSIKLFCDAITSGAADIGLYQTTANGGAVVDADAYASAQTIASANVLGIEVAFEARNITAVEQQVWQDAGLTADPQRMYDLVATLTAAAAANGDLTFIVEYVIL